jgi:SNF2 family DNA or RNA helicase
MDRVHRLGQTRPVFIVRYLADDTIEERILKLQEAKAALSKGALAKLTPEEARRARTADLCMLFEMDVPAARTAAAGR